MSVPNKALFHSGFRPTFLGLILVLAGLLSSFGSLQAQAIEFERVVIDPNFPSAYQVEVFDVNGDGKLDIIAVGGDTCAWYENPTWTKRVITNGQQTPGIISSATADLDGDGKAEVAIAYEFEMNEPKKGKLLLARQGPSLDAPWTVKPIAAIGSIHRLRWGDFNQDQRLDLVVAPIFGPQATPPFYAEEPAHLLMFDTGRDPIAGDWTKIPIGDLHVTHAIAIVDLDRDKQPEVLAASNLGVNAFKRAATPPHTFTSRSLTTGAPGEAPKRGSSEVHVGQLRGGETRFLATVEPWHGSEVAVCLEDPKNPGSFGPRTVIDQTLKEGHALWVADVDLDGSDEIFAGYRGKGTRVVVYQFDGKGWKSSVVDDQIAAQDLRGGDLDDDGRPDVVAVGGSTHNLVWYRARPQSR